jgi:hypothetical protein
MKPPSPHWIPTLRVPKDRLCEVREVTDRLAEISELAEKLADEYTILLKKLATLREGEEKPAADREAGVESASATSFDLELRNASDVPSGTEDPHSGLTDAQAGAEPAFELSFGLELEGAADVAPSGADDPHSGIVSLSPSNPEGEEEVTGRYSLKGTGEVVRIAAK